MGPLSSAFLIERALFPFFEFGAFLGQKGARQWLRAVLEGQIL